MDLKVHATHPMPWAEYDKVAGLYTSNMES